MPAGKPQLKPEDKPEGYFHQWQFHRFVTELRSSIARQEGNTNEHSRRLKLVEELSASVPNLVKEIESTCEKKCTKLQDELDRFKKESATQMEIMRNGQKECMDRLTYITDVCESWSTKNAETRHKIGALENQLDNIKVERQESLEKKATLERSTNERCDKLEQKWQIHEKALVEVGRQVQERVGGRHSATTHSQHPSTGEKTSMFHNLGTHKTNVDGARLAAHASLIEITSSPILNQQQHLEPQVPQIQRAYPGRTDSSATTESDVSHLAYPIPTSPLIEPTSPGAPSSASKAPKLPDSDWVPEHKPAAKVQKQFRQTAAPVLASPRMTRSKAKIAPTKRRGGHVPPRAGFITPTLPPLPAPQALPQPSKELTRPNHEVSKEPRKRLASPVWYNIRDMPLYKSVP